MKISVVIPSYNGRHLLEKNLSHVVSALLYAEEKVRISGEIVIVDDGSSDGTEEFLKDLVKSSKDIPISCVINQKNKGFSPTVNRGVKNTTGEIVILLNTDVTPQKDFILPLLTHFENQDVFAVACMDKSIEGEKTVLRGRGIGRWHEGYLKHNAGSLDRNDTLWVSGGSGAFRKSIWDKLGGLCELYAPYYWEDIDLSYRALKAGYLTFFERESVVIHRHEDGIIKKSQPAGKVTKIVNRNQNIFVLLNATDFAIIFSYFIYLPLHLARALKNKDWYYIQGLIMLLPFITSITAVRARNKKLFVRSDKEVVTPFSS